jgi:hypothetical protein
MATITTNTPWRDKKGIAAHFGTCPRTVTNWMRARRIPYSKIGRVVRFNVHKCEKAIEAMEVKSVAWRDD